MTRELITRGQIYAITGASAQKVSTICRLANLGSTAARGFPIPSGKVGKKLGYSRAAIESWAKNNDLAAMVFTAAEHGGSKMAVAAQPIFDNALATLFLSSTPAHHRRPSAGTGRTTVVRLIERNDYTPPSRHTAWPSGREHSYSLSLPGVWS